MIFETEHTARVPHKCCQCAEPIKPGEQYVRVRITPRHDDYGNTGWLRYSSHPPGGCNWWCPPTFYAPEATATGTRAGLPGGPART